MKGARKETEWSVVAVEGAVEDNDVESLEEGMCEVGRLGEGDVKIKGGRW